MIDINSALTGSLGPSGHLTFRAYIFEGDYGRGESKQTWWCWFIDFFDPRFDRKGYKPCIVSDHHTNSDSAERQMRAVLQDLGAELDEVRKVAAG